MKSLRVCTQEEPRNWILRLACDWRVAKGGTRVKHARELKGHASWSTTEQNFQTGKTVSSQLVPVASSSHQNALFAFLTHPSINILIPTKCRELLERILREKP